MNPVPALASVPPAFEQQARTSPSPWTHPVHSVDAARAFAADPSRPEPRWGA
jgi:hypothetical protein